MNKIEELEAVVDLAKYFTISLTEIYSDFIEAKNNNYKSQKISIKRKYLKKGLIFSIINIPIIFILLFLMFSNTYMIIPLLLVQIVYHLYLKNIDKKIKNEEDKMVREYEDFRNKLFEVVDSSRKKYQYLNKKLEEEKAKDEYSDIQEYYDILDEYCQNLESLNDEYNYPVFGLEVHMNLKKLNLPNDNKQS